MDRDEKKLQAMRTDPAKEMDIQTCVKYLTFSYRNTQRKPAFFTVFHVELDAYSSCLGEAIKIRNKYFHETADNLKAIDRQGLAGDMEILYQLFAPMANQSWPCILKGKPSPADFVKETKHHPLSGSSCRE